MSVGIGMVLAGLLLAVLAFLGCRSPPRAVQRRMPRSSGFADAAVGLFSSMDRLHAWSKASLLGTIRELGFTPDADVRRPLLAGSGVRPVEDLHARRSGGGR
jgi:hypothetical protein